ncbi:MAG: helix-turn-helix domain-containing protein [Patescibacteria group bacterium]
MSGNIGVGMVPSKTMLGAFIRTRRLKLGLSQPELAKLSSVQQNTISMLEMGSQRSLKPPQSARLAKVLKCTVQDLQDRVPVQPVNCPRTELGTLVYDRRTALNMSFGKFISRVGLRMYHAKRLESDVQVVGYKTLQKLVKVLRLDMSVLGKFLAERSLKDTNSPLGTFIRTRRKGLGLSCHMLARKVGRNRAWMSYIELGVISLAESDSMF